MRFLGVIFFYLIACLHAYAQQPQSWGIYFGQTTFKNSKFGIHHEVQVRDHKLFGDHNQSLVRVGAQYQFKPYLQGTMGYGFIYNEAEGEPNLPFVEHRIYQEATLSHRFKIVNLRHRFRLEERFIENQDFRGRLRYCLFVDVPLTEKGMGKNGTYLALYNEVFVNVMDSNLDRFDRNRLYGGVGYRLSQSLGVQLGYMRQHVGKQSGTNHILLSFHHKILL